MNFLMELADCIIRCRKEWKNVRLTAVPEQGYVCVILEESGDEYELGVVDVPSWFLSWVAWETYDVIGEVSVLDNVVRLIEASAPVSDIWRLTNDLNNAWRWYGRAVPETGCVRIDMSA
jgi:hypothetical protein